MFTFIRKIRKRLLDGGRTSKYVLYAIGEIALVVIGILIALQINNWNEERKLRNEELNHLKEVKSNLEATLKSFKNDSVTNLGHIQQYEKIKYYIRGNASYSSELDTAFGRLKSWSSPYPIYTAYTTLKTKGLDIISNASLRNKIANLYEYEFKRLSTDYDMAEWLLYESVVLPFYSKFLRIYRGDARTLARPNDFEMMKNSDEFMNVLELLINERENGLNMYRTIMMKVQDLIESIESELNLR